MLGIQIYVCDTKADVSRTGSLQTTTLLWSKKPFIPTEKLYPLPPKLGWVPQEIIHKHTALKIDVFTTDKPARQVTLPT